MTWRQMDGWIKKPSVMQNQTCTENRGSVFPPHLDAAAALLLQQDVLGLEVAVDDAVLVQRVQTLQDGVGELPDQREAEALELVLLDELVQVHAEQLEGHADVVSEGEVLQHVDDVHARVLVLLPQVLQDADLFRRLPVEALLVADHLQSHVGLRLVVEGLHHLQEEKQGALINLTATIKLQIHFSALKTRSRDITYMYIHMSLSNICSLIKNSTCSRGFYCSPTIISSSLSVVDGTD